jgi:hypothetical protein
MMDKNYCPQCAARGIAYQNTSSTNALAIVSLIFGIISFPGAFCYGCGVIFAIVAIITGVIARSQIKQSANRQSGDGLALAGLILGSVVTGLVVLGGGCYLLFILFSLLLSSTSQYSLLTGLGSLLFLI